MNLRLLFNPFWNFEEKLWSASVPKEVDIQKFVHLATYGVEEKNHKLELTEKFSRYIHEAESFPFAFFLRRR